MLRTILLTALIGAQALVGGAARADEGTAPVPYPTDAASRTRIDWFVRLQLGLRTVTPSAQQDLLAKDGYDASPRFVMSGEFARQLTPVVGVSGWTDFSIRSSKPDRGPTMSEDVLMFGAGMPLVPVGWQGTALVIVPRFGYGWSWMSIGGHAEPVGALVYGGDLVVAWPHAHFNVAFGWLNAPTRPPGDAGRRSNFGGVGLTVGGVFDG